MKIPFSQEQFLDVFKNYNEAIFPFQFMFYALALLALFATLNNKLKSTKITIIILAFFWLWMGFIYHFVFFSTINKAAYLFGSLFIVEAVLLVIYGIIKNRLEFRFHANRLGLIATILCVYALIIYPLLGYINGRIYPSSPTFGLPCPTTIFTFSILIMAERKIPFLLLAIPILWSFTGFFAALHLGIPEDFGLLVAGIITITIVFLRNSHLIKASLQAS